MLPAIKIPNFELLEPVGKGGMGSVYLARQENPRREVAIKVIAPDVGLPEAMLEGLKQEGDIAARFRHPNLVTVYECGVIEGHYYLAMEFLPGGTLEDRLQDAGGPLDEEEARRIMRAIIDALGHIHGKGFIHRDLKPANVLFDEQDRPVLADFGIAKVSEAEGLMTKLGYSVGTPPYMSPEQIQNLPLDGRSDLYSMGIVFQQMITGELPFDADSDFAVKQAHVTQRPPPLPAHLQHCQRVLDRLLAKEPGERYADAAQVLSALDAVDDVAGRSCVEHATVPQPAQPAPPRAPPGPQASPAVAPRRSPFRFVLPGLVIVVLAALGLWYGWYGADEVAPPALEAATPPTLAVMPLLDIGPEQDAEFLAASLSEDLINRLAQVDGLLVIGRTGMVALRDEEVALDEIRELLGVEYVLEGSFRRIDDRLTLNVQLVRTDDGFQAWSHRYEQSASDLLAVQQEIVESVVIALSIELGVGDLGTHPGGTNSFEAFELFLRAGNWGPESITESIELLKDALEVDPEFALAWFELAERYALAPMFLEEASPEEWFARSREALERGLALWPEGPLDTVLDLQTSNGQWAENERLLRLQEGLATGSDMWNLFHFANYLQHVDRFEEAERLLLRARRLDPLNPMLAQHLAHTYLAQGRLADALAQVEEAIELGAWLAHATVEALMISLSMDDAELIRTWANRAADANDEEAWAIHRAMAEHLGAPDEALPILEASFGKGSTHMDYHLQLWAAYFGHDELSLAAKQRSPDTWSMWVPINASLRRTEGFKEIMRQLGLETHWREYGWGTHCRPVDEADFVCE